MKRLIPLLVLVTLSPFTEVARAGHESLRQESIGAPFMVRDYSFPGFLLLGFTPAPTAPLGKNNTAIELRHSIINDFQVSPEVENYLHMTRNGSPRRLDGSDVDYILSLPQGSAYYIDGEFSMSEFAFMFGLTDRVDIGLGLNYIHYGGHLLDEIIYDFHEGINVGQGGRGYVENNQVQVVLGRDNGSDVVMLTSPSSGGMIDPHLFVRIALPDLPGDWHSSLALGVKPALMNEEKFLSTGSWDVGFQLTTEKQFTMDSLLLNVGSVSPGRFKQTDFNPPNLPFLNISWIHQFESWPYTRSFVQALFAEHPYHELVDSELGELEFQMTLGMKWDTSLGIFGLGITENLLNFNNTPDFGIHFIWSSLP